MKTITSIVLALALLLTTAAAANAATAVHYLRSRQTASGGFAEAGSGTPSVVVTEWAMMGLRAAGVAPGAVHRSGGRTAISFLASRSGRWSDAYGLERGILAVVAARYNPKSFAGRNLVAALRGKIGGHGGIGPAANSTYWGVIALRAAGSPVPARTLSYIRSRRHRNGGYAWSKSAAPDSNDTAAAVLALHAAGVPCGDVAIRRGLAYIRSAQGAGHGYALLPGSAADSQSTSWAIQARHACGLRNARARAWLLARRLPSGAYNYQPGSTVTPAFVTAQVLPAVHGRWYPIR
jgi:energy-coupling factor transport system substrate-specific component